MTKRKVSDKEIKADVMNRLLRKHCWGAKYLPLITFINWLSKQIKKNGKRIRRLIRQLVNERYLLLHKKGATVSLNPAKSREIVEFIERILKA